LVVFYEDRKNLGMLQGTARLISRVWDERDKGISN